MLLVLGGVLLTVAAIAFTLVSWGHMGIAGRAAVLGAVTCAALAAPVPLLKRGLRSTAESVAGLGLVLTVLDAYALHEVAAPGARTARVRGGRVGACWPCCGRRTDCCSAPCACRSRCASMARPNSRCCSGRWRPTRAITRSRRRCW